MKHILPKILNSSFKGQNGRLAIIGGCLEYTGAPFYSSISQLKGGSDLAHIFCTKQAAIPIKAYSPEVITHPYLFSYNEEENPHKLTKDQINEKINKSISLVCEWQVALNSFVIGPGLGRDQWISQYLGDIIVGFKQKQIVILDADGLWYLMSEYSKQFTEGKIYKSIIKNDPQYHILTPNQAEFERMWKTFMESSPFNREERIRQMQKYIQNHYGINDDIQKYLDLNNQNKDIGDLQFIEMTDLSHPIVFDAVQLSNKLNNINIIQKGMIDVITNGKKAYMVLEKSSLKRCGGIGDILSGLVGLYSFWGQRSYQQILQTKDQQQFTKEQADIDESTRILLGCVLGSCITRKSSFQAYQKNQFSLTAPNIIDYIGPTFMAVYDNLNKGQNQKL